MKTKLFHFRKNTMHTKTIDLTGLRFGRLLVDSVGDRVDKKVRWRCVCDCGLIKVVRGACLRSGKTRSCGCLAMELKTARIGKRKGEPKKKCHPPTTTWMSMIQRCCNPKSDGWKWYGARGIKVCERWMKRSNFLEDMLPSWSSGLTLDRIDVNGDYCPENCRWATMKKQNRNRRNNRIITLNGVSGCLSWWSEMSGVSKMAISYRISKGWSLQSAIFTKPIARNSTQPNDNYRTIRGAL
jgi:hypothetical protein